MVDEIGEECAQKKHDRQQQQPCIDTGRDQLPWLGACQCEWEFVEEATAKKELMSNSKRWFKLDERGQSRKPLVHRARAHASRRGLIFEREG